MLTLTRRSGERIRIGSQVVIVVKEVHGNQVKLGIEAPRSVQVYREELYQKLVESNRAATTVESEQLESWLRELGDED
ncbi:MAG: carbon storage regulator [Deltaproteobacteria bacterium]|nr:MAG: carbon storage regulator [Deltaproteobacteria bacterium]